MSRGRREHIRRKKYQYAVMLEIKFVIVSIGSRDALSPMGRIELATRKNSRRPFWHREKKREPIGL